MADNYLERQREQYEARKAAWEKAKKRTRIKKGNKIPKNKTSHIEAKRNIIDY